MRDDACPKGHVLQDLVPGSARESRGNATTVSVGSWMDGREGAEQKKASCMKRIYDLARQIE